MKGKAFLEWDLILYSLIAITICLLSVFSFRSYLQFRFDVKAEQMDFIDAALDKYGADHLMVKEVSYDDEENMIPKMKKTYPETLEDLMDSGYMNDIADVEDFEYKAYKKDARYIYYELKIKKPLSDSYYVSEGSSRSKYMAEND